MRDQLRGHIEAEANFGAATRADAQSVVRLTHEEQAIADGEKGELLQKAMRTVVAYGQLFGANRLVDLAGAPHMAMSWGTDAVEPFLKIYKQFGDAGLKTYAPFTANPRPMDRRRLDPGPEKRAMVEKIYHRQEELEHINLRIGMRDNDSWSCACYLEEMGNTPKHGDYLAWSESSAVNFVNSVLGARTNRNPMGIDMMCNILGKSPLFGLMTYMGRQASWLIDVRTKELPHPSLLGSAIGMKVFEDTPYIIGMDKLLKEINDQTIGYLKDMGAATASSGAVGLYHVEGITPDALDHGRNVVKDDYQTYVIDDAELDRVYGTYPNLWKDPHDRPQRVFIGCPHNTVEQLCEWGERIVTALDGADKQTVAVPTFLFAALPVKQAFRERYSDVAEAMKSAGVVIARNCPVMYLSTPLQADELIATNSNKCQVSTTARFFIDDDLTYIITTGKLPVSG